MISFVSSFPNTVILQEYDHIVDGSIHRPTIGSIYSGFAFQCRKLSQFQKYELFTYWSSVGTLDVEYQILNKVNFICGVHDL